MQKNFNIVWPKVSNKQEIKSKNILLKKNTPLIKDTIRRSNEIRGQVIIIKLSSSIISQDYLLTNFVENVQLLSMCGAKIYIVHDHTNLVNETLNMFGIDEKIIHNIKVSDYKSAQIIEMVISGYINKLIVSKFCSIGSQAIGISGKDGNLIQAKKNNIKLKRREGLDKVIDIGFVSEPIIINPEILLNFENSEIIPVISPIACDDKGNTHLLNVDLTAVIISSSLDADHLILPCEDIRYLKVKNIDTKTLQKCLLNKNYSFDILKKIDANLDIFENANNVHFVNALVVDSILLSLFDNKK